MAPFFSSPVSKLSPSSLVRSKDLDFLILAGCSCLITLLHHPMVNHLQGGNGSASAPGSTGSSGSTPTTTAPSPGQPSSQSSLGYYNPAAPRRQSFTIEEEEA